jgi:hypothetical protein
MVIAADKQPVFAADCHLPQRALRSVVVEFQMRILSLGAG